jgi:hypothetical protein
MSGRSFKMALALSLSLSAAPAATAQDAPVGFRTPSKNIACQFFVLDGQTTLRCDIVEVATRPPRPADCDLDWGDAFEMTMKGPPASVCHGDTVRDPALPVLAYGEVWQRGGFTCRSEQSGLTCFNAMQHGFSLSRAAQKLF